MSTDYKVLGKRIKHRRQNMDLSQEQLALKSGFSKTHISNVENAHTIPSVQTILSISAALGTTPDALLLGNIHDNEAEQFREYCERLLLCSARDQKIVFQLVDTIIDNTEK